jgi:uncharacterized protein (DUF427 family)
VSNSGPGYAKNPEHEVTVAPFAGRVVVRAGGETIVDTREALALREASYPPVYYVPRKDARMERLKKTEHRSYCPFKGDASYFTIEGGAENAAWSYETPFDEVAAIREALAFYPKRVDAIEVTPD